MISRIFSLQDQNNFAQLSGDYNPVHVDPDAARRLMFGYPIVHGIHSVLWALDVWLNDQQLSVCLTKVKAVFPKPVLVNDEVHYKLKAENQHQAVIELSVAGKVVLKLSISYELQTSTENIVAIKNNFPDKLAWVDQTIEEMENQFGTLKLYLEETASERLFPALSSFLPDVQLTEMLATTRLVGMISPGLNSVYSDLSMTFNNKLNHEKEFSYRVIKTDNRFSLVTLSLEGPDMKGEIRAFVRPKPHQQAGYEKIKREIKADEFAREKALIIGGTRGIGEVTAKLLAAGGADVIITWFRGKEESDRIVREIVSAGGRASSIKFNVLDPQLRQFTQDWFPTLLYYYATPFIFDSSKGQFSTELFNKFCDYYVSGFSNCVKGLREISDQLKAVLYPSSVAMDEVPVFMGEYTVAKAAGEKLCEYLEKTEKGLRIYRPRFPRLATDQTMSMMPVNNKDPMEEMIFQLREFRRLQEKTEVS